MTQLPDYKIPERPPVAWPGNNLLYISGPMSGKENYNYDLFFQVEAILHEMGYNTINPARLDDELGWPEDGEWSSFLSRDLKTIISSGIDGIVLFGDWHNSRGAVLEAYVAKMLDIPVYQLHRIGPAEDEMYDILPLDEPISVALEAQDIVLGARRYTYGHPLDNFQTIADLLNATLSHKLKEPLTVQDVALMMIQVKVGREINKPHRDNRTDIIGYALALDEAIREEEFRQYDTFRPAI